MLSAIALLGDTLNLETLFTVDHISLHSEGFLNMFLGKLLEGALELA